MAARDEKKYHHAITWYINRFSSQISAEIVDLDSLGLTSLHHAPSTRILSVLLPHCDNINVGQNSLNGTPLHYYASKGSLELVDFILSKGADLNALDVCSNTALHLAAENGHLSIVKVLVEKGLSVMARNEEGCIPLHLACENGWNDCVRYLISKGASVNVKNKNEDTPLHDACRLNSIEVASYLVEHGANIFSPDCDGDTPLGWSSFFGNEDLASFLASKGGIELINSQCGNMDTPLHWACKKGYDQIVEFLLEKGASPNLKNANLQTPLHWACSSSGHTYYQCANILFGAEVNAVDKDANTPLHFACKTSNAELVQWLLEENAAVNSRNKYGETPFVFFVPRHYLRYISLIFVFGTFSLDVARKHRQKDIINYLTEYISSLEEEIASNQDEIVLALPLYNRLHSAIKDCSNSLLPNLIQKYPDDVNHAVNEGLTPLHLACMTGNFEAVKLLHEAGANPTVKDKKYGNAAIHWAVNGSHANIVQYLIRSADVDINVINLRQNTPLMIAMENGDEAITWLLLTYGADLSAKNEDGKTATDKAGKNVKVLNLVWLWTGVSTVLQRGEFLEIEKGEWIREQVSTWGADSRRISQHWKSKRFMKSRSTESNNPTEIARVTYEKVRALLKSYEQKGFIDKVNVLHYINMFFDDTEAIIRQWSDCQKQYKTLSGKVEKFLPSAPGTKVAPDEKVKDLEEDIRDFQNNTLTNFRQKLAPEFPTNEDIITFKGEMEVLRSYSSCLESTMRSLEKAKESVTQNLQIILEQPFTSVILAPYMGIFIDFTEPHRKDEPESMLGILNTIFDQEKLDSSNNGGQTTRRTMLGRGMGLVGNSASEGDSDESTNSLPIHQLQDTVDTQHDVWEDVSTEDSSAGSSFIKSGKIIPTLPIPSSLGVKESIQYKPLLEFIHKHLVTYIDHLINRYNGLSIIIKKNLTIIEQIEEARSSIVQQVLSDLVQFENSLAEGLGKVEAGGVHSKGGLFGFVTKFKFGEKPDKDSRQSKKSRMSGM
ncbi:ankyrin repeat-containing domain protein [Paraphysoderma sedebokerense]|nr:ankyrin repeat-containing domain protein [Paraphysoderma sedebokerense]